MVPVIPERMAAQIDGDFVVFLIGMRINKFWKLHKWWPAAAAMMRMQRELKTRPAAQTGCMESRMISPGITVQYWRSFAHLEAYAKNPDGLHLPAWKRFNTVMKNARGDVGIWHETFLVKAGNYEALYSGMPLQGLAKAGGVVPATGKRATAKGRIHPQSDAPKDPVT